MSIRISKITCLSFFCTKFIYNLMKTFICFALSAILVSCNSGSPKNMQEENDSLQTVLRGRDAKIEGFIKTFDEVKHLLDSITLREKRVVMKTENISDLKKPLIITEINTDITAINKLIKENSEKIAKLNSELKAGNFKKPAIAGSDPGPEYTDRSKRR